MASHLELAEYIRFALDKLGARNAAHEFEDLARHVARQLISPLFIPATGPVSAGGDQGRDGESIRDDYNSRCKKGGRRLVLACTIQRERLEKKVRDDVEKIVQGHPPADGIYFFCTSDMPVATRHKLQAWAAETYEIELELIDGRALSEFLAIPELFWIAQEILRVPPELYPASPHLHESYGRLRSEWQESGRIIVDFNDIAIVSNAAHECFSKKHPREDVHFWLGHLRRGLQHIKSDSHNRRRLLYQYSCLTLLSERSLARCIEQVREYIADIQRQYDLHELLDISSLLILVDLALGNEAQETREEVLAWQTWLEDTLVIELSRYSYPTEYCYLWTAKAQAAMSSHGVAIHGSKQLDFITACFDKVVSEIPNTLNFPVLQFATFLEKAEKGLNHLSSFIGTQRRLEEQVERISGAGTAGHRKLRRARKLFEKGDLLAALVDYSAAIPKLQSSDFKAIRAFASSDVAEICETQGLNILAKRFYLVALYSLSLPPHDRSVTQEMLEVAGRVLAIDVADGRWATALRFALILAEPLKLEEHTSLTGIDEATTSADSVGEQLKQMISELATTYLSQGGQSEALKEAYADHWHILEPVCSRYRSSRQASPYLKPNAMTTPFLDTGNTYRLRWTYAESSWEIRSAHEPEAILASEAFAAALQAAQLSVTDYRGALLPASIQVRVELSAEQNATIETQDKGTRRDFVVRLNSLPMSEEDYREIWALAATLLGRFAPKELLERAGTSNIATGIALSAAGGHPAEPFAIIGSPQLLRLHPPRIHQPKQSRLIPVHDQPGLSPLLTDTDVRDAIQHRYEKLIPATERTMLRIRQTPRARLGCQRFLRDGHPKWHLLATIANINAHYRNYADGNALFDPKDVTQEYVDEYMERHAGGDALSDYDPPLSAYSYNNLLYFAGAFLGAFLDTHGYSYTAAVDESRLEDFAIRRLGYHWDIEAYANSVLLTSTRTATRKRKSRKK